MQPPNVVSEAQAWNWAQQFADAIVQEIGSEVLAVVVVGSLAAGLYRPGRSDIDTVVLIKTSSHESTEERIKRIRDYYELESGISKGFGAVAIREDQLIPPYPGEAELVPEIFRLKNQGLVLKGNYKLASIPKPTKQDFLAYAAHFYPWLRENYVEQRPIEEETVDSIVNTILYELRLHVWEFTGNYILNKPEVIPTFTNLKGTEHFNLQLQLIQNYLLGDDGADMTVSSLCQLLREVSNFVRRVVLFPTG